MRLNGPGVTHDYIGCGECGAPMSPYSFTTKRDCATHREMAYILAAGNQSDAWRVFHYQPDHGTFGSIFLREEAP